MSRIRALFLVGFWFTAIAVLGPVIVTLCAITGNENFIYKPVRPFIRLGLWLVGVRVEVRGRENLVPGTAYVFTPNHQSFIEVPLFVAYLDRNPAYLAKKELFRYPVFGRGISLIGVVPVDRSNTQAAVESAKAATEKLRRGKSYIVYPEGTRTPDGRVLPFKKGAFLMAVDAGAPIVPVSVSGGARIMPKGKLRIYPSTVRVTLHPPIPTSGYSKGNVDRLIEVVRAKVLSALTEESETDVEQLNREKGDPVEAGG